MSSNKICPRCGEAYDDDVAFCAKDGTRLVRGGQPTDLIGTVIAERYRVVSRLGEGGMGQVYLAEHVRMKRKSAIKIMRPSLVGDVDALQRFTREAENASQLSHPNIAAIFDFGETPDGVVYLAMEYVDGGSLADKMEQYAVLHPDVAADILGQAADALQVAHDMSMLHRDIKPDNIMLGKRPDGTYMVKLVDFGIARTMDSVDQNLTRTGFAVGTPQYMSPEQLSGELLDARSDQYSLALVAFFALTGKQAFPAESSKESLIARLTSRPQTLQTAKHDVEWPDALQEIFDRALAPEPAERFATVSEFAHALAGAISNMTPTQTAELYRRALDMRVANVAARTPHGDLEALRTPSGTVLTLGAPSTGSEVVSTTGARALPGASGDAGVDAGRVGSTSGVRESDASGATRTASGLVADTPPAASTQPRRLWISMASVAVVVAVIAAVMLRRSTGDASLSVVVDSAAVANAAALGSIDSASFRAVDAISTDSARVMALMPGQRASTNAASGLPNSAANDTARRAQRDSLKRAEARREREAKDSSARVNNLRARFPEVAAQAALARGIDAKARMTRSGDVRVNIMPTPVFLWRSAQSRAWMETHPQPTGGNYDAVDPIERWSSWNALVTARRAVYVLEVSPEKAPWPSYEPSKIYEIKRGDISSVEMLRDGAPITLDAISRIPAVVNAAEHAAAGKPVPNTLVATLSPTTFVLREDGTLPKIELLVHDASRNGAVTRVVLSESLVRRLYDDFAPWRDALARP